MTDFNFWSKWLAVVCWALVVFGFALALFNQAPLFNVLFNFQVDPVFWLADAISPAAKMFQQWIYGVLGAVLAGWAVFMIFLVRHAFPLKRLWVWRCFAFGIGTWFVLDTALSLYFGVVFNAVFNLLLVVALGIPLAATRKHFVS